MLRDETSTSEEQRTLASRDCRRGTGAQTRRRGDTRDRAQLRRRGKARGAPRARGNGRCGAGKLTPQSRQVRGMPASLGAYWRGEHSCTGWPCTAPTLPCGQKASIDHRPLRTSQGTRYTLKRQPPSDAPCPADAAAAGWPCMHAQRAPHTAPPWPSPWPLRGALAVTSGGVPAPAPRTLRPLVR